MILRSVTSLGRTWPSTIFWRADEKPDMDYSIALLADDTAALMDHSGFSEAHIIGVSMGGTIAQELALRHALKVRSLVLGCTTPGGPKAIRLGGGGARSPLSASV